MKRRGSEPSCDCTLDLHAFDVQNSSSRSSVDESDGMGSHFEPGDGSEEQL